MAAEKKYATEEERRLAINAQKRARRHKNGGPKPEGRPWQYFTVEEAKAAKVEGQRQRRAMVRAFEKAQQKIRQDSADSTINNPLVVSEPDEAKTSGQQQRGPGRPRKYANDAERKAAHLTLEKQQRAAYAAAIKASKDEAAAAITKRGPGRPRKYQSEEEAQIAQKEQRRIYAERRKAKARSNANADGLPEGTDKQIPVSSPMILQSATFAYREQRTDHMIGAS
jgi:hypothetical protein